MGGEYSHHCAIPAHRGQLSLYCLSTRLQVYLNVANLSFFFIENVAEENLFYIVSPKDLVLAKVCF